jgi:hypothetical protein
MLEKLLYENLPNLKKFKVREQGPVEDLYSYSLFIPER